VLDSTVSDSAVDAPKNLSDVVLVGVVLVRRRVSAVQHPMPQVRR